MTHNQKQMINTNRAVIVKFLQSTSDTQLTSSGDANIYIPFPVKEIKVKGVDLDFNADFRTLYFTSNLVDDFPLGSGYAGIMFDNSTSTKHLHYIFDSPRDINGSYRFTYNVLDDRAFYFANGFMAGQGIPDAEFLAPPPGGAINPNITQGAPAGRVLFMLEFIGYK